MKRAPVYDAGDVLIVGAGAAGALAALSLGRAGHRVTLLEGMAFGAEQSSHSHGYLHNGYIYLAGTTTLSDRLVQGAEQWKACFDRYRLAPEVGTAQILFTNHFNATAAIAHWRQAGLPVHHQAPEPLLAGSERFVAAFRTDERSYDFSGVFTELAKECGKSAALVYGTADRVMVADRSLVTGIRVISADGSEIELRARRYVLAAGVENERLIRGATNSRGLAYARTSFMLVVKSVHLPLISYINPENRGYGLFVSSRREGNRGVWLVSNFLSYARLADSPLVTRCWVDATWSTLKMLTSILDFSDLELGLYVAPKMELRAQPGMLQGHAAERYGLENVMVVAPTKLTLAPILAEQIRDEIGVLGTSPPTRGGREIGAVVGEIPVATERWRDVETRPVGEFISRMRERVPRGQAVSRR